MRCYQAFVVLLALSCVGLEARHAVVNHHSHNHHHHSALKEQEEEEEVPQIVLVVLGDLLIEWAAGLIWDTATADRSGKCLIRSPEINTFYGRGGHRIVDDDMLRLCATSPLTYTSNASKQRKWNVHAQHWTLFNDCLFEFEWQFAPSGTIYDCTKDTIVARHGQATYDRLRRKYPNDLFFSKYVGGVRMNIKDCDLYAHQGYVQVFPSLPASAFSRDPGPSSRFAASPYFYINVEGWTGGSCSGSKGPGVKWVFTYKINVNTGTVSYVTQFNSSHRPYVINPTYIPHLCSGCTTPGKKVVDTYQEKTKADAEVLGINLDG